MLLKILPRLKPKLPRLKPKLLLPAFFALLILCLYGTFVVHYSNERSNEISVPYNFTNPKNKLEVCKRQWFVEITWHQWYNEMLAVYNVELNKLSEKTTLPTLFDPTWIKQAGAIFDDAINNGHNTISLFEKLTPLERCKVLLGFLSINGVPKIPSQPYDLKPVIKKWVEHMLKDEVLTQR